MAIRKALSEGLYHMEKYMIHEGTTAASGMPKKKRAASRPVALFTPAMASTTAPHRIMMTGRNTLAENFFMAMLAGSRPAVTAKYVIETAQLNSVPLR